MNKFVVVQHRTNRALLAMVVGGGVVFFCLLTQVVDWVVLPATFIVMMAAYSGMRYLNDDHFPYSIGFFTWIVTGYSLGLAPILNEFFGYYVSNYSEVYLAAGWENVVFRSTLVSFAFVTIMFLLDNVRGDKVLPVSQKYRWEFNSFKIRFWAPLFLVTTALLQTYVYYSVGGVFNYMDGDVRRGMEGAGKILMISESFPVILSFVYAAYYIRKGRMPGLLSVMLFVVLFLVVRMYFGGLRGSRSNIIWALFWLIGIVHIFLRPLRLSVFVAFAALVFVFSSVYSLYKTHGQKMITEEVSWDTSESTRYEGNASVGLLLEDFSRSGVQAVIVDQYFNRVTYEPTWGSTYLHALLLIVPGPFGDQFTSKVEAGTDLLYGVGSFGSGYFSSSRVYGFVGEAVMNFTPFLAPLTALPLFLLYLFLLSYFKDRSLRDVRMLFMPFAINFLFVILASDLDNTVFFTIKNGVIPFVFLYLITDKKGPYEREAAIFNR